MNTSQLQLSSTTQSPKPGRPAGKISLTSKQIKYISALAEGKSKNESKSVAGYKNGSASSGIEKSPALRQALIVAMERRGLTSEYLAEKIKIGMNVKKTNFFAYEGRIIDSKTVPDNETQHKYVRTALDVRGDLLRENEKFSVQVGIVEIPRVATDAEAWNSA